MHDGGGRARLQGASAVRNSAACRFDKKGLAAQRIASAPQRFQSFSVIPGILYQDLERVDLIYELPFREQGASLYYALDVELVEGRAQKLISYFFTIGREHPDD